MSALGVLAASVAAVTVGYAARALRAPQLSRARAERRSVATRRDDLAGVVATAIRFGTAARESVTVLRSAIAAAMQEAAPGSDGVLVYEEQDGIVRCVAAFGERFAYYAENAVAVSDDGALPVRAIVAAHHVRLADGMRALHPRDADAVALPLSLGPARRCAVAVAACSVLDDAAIARLVTLAELASPAYRIALEREDDRHRAEYDGLTGLLTPRAFRERLTALVARGRHAPGTSLALVFVDTDHFKRWNDSYGHAAGDALLRELAIVLRGFAPPDRDLVARNGGDEFCLVFAETDKAAAIERAEALHRRIASIDFAALHPAAPHASLRVTASIGVAAFPADAVTASELLERADAAMYHSKETGRDGVSYRGLDGGFVRLRREERA